MDMLSRDLRYAVRRLIKSPGFTLIAILTLAVGVGATTAIFSLVDGIVLRGLPYADADRLVSISLQRDVSISKAEYVALRARREVFDGVAAYSGWGFTLTGGDEPLNVSGAKASASLFTTLGVTPVLGRTFLPDEDLPGRSQVAVIGYGLWQRSFGGDTDIVGRSVTLDGLSYSVVGIMPADFRFPERASEIWIPATIDPANAQDYSTHYLRLVARLSPSVAVARAREDVEALSRRLREEASLAPAHLGNGVSVVQLHDQIVGPLRRQLFLLLGAVVLVMMIACANVANLMLARASYRRREMAVRTALGAGRRQLIRQLFTESIALALVGGALGMLFAVWAVDALVAWLPGDTPRVDEIGVDARVLGFAMLITMGTAVLFGAMPALRASRTDINSTLRGDRGGSEDHGRGRLRRTLVIGEIALALVLVAGAGLLLQSLWRLNLVDPGFRPEHLLSMTVSAPAARYAEPHQQRAFIGATLERIEQIPGVQSAGAIQLLPLGGNRWNPGLRIEGRELSPGAELPVVEWRVVTPAYFRTLGIPLHEGRMFEPQDREGAPPVALVSETIARRLFPDGNAIGARINTGFEGKNNWVHVVGVVGDVREYGLRESPQPIMYRPFEQTPFSSMVVIARTSGEPLDMAAAVRNAIRAIDRDVPVSDIQAMQKVVDDSIARPRALTSLLAAFAAVALMLGALGIYGVMSNTVASRTREIGVRMALGARAIDVLRMVLREGMILTLIGVTVGIAAALTVTRVLTSLLYEVTATDPITFLAVALLLAAVAVLACYLPASRATRVDPMTVMRAE